MALDSLRVVDPLQILSSVYQLAPDSPEQAQLLSKLRENLEFRPNPIPILCTSLLKSVSTQSDSLLKRWVLDLLHFAISRSSLSSEVRTNREHLYTLFSQNNSFSSPPIHTQSQLNLLTSSLPSCTTTTLLPSRLSFNHSPPFTPSSSVLCESLFPPILAHTLILIPSRVSAVQTETIGNNGTPSPPQSRAFSNSYGPKTLTSVSNSPP